MITDWLFEVEPTRIPGRDGVDVSIHARLLNGRVFTVGQYYERSGSYKWLSFVIDRQIRRIITDSVT